MPRTHEKVMIAETVCHHLAADMRAYINAVEMFQSCAAATTTTSAQRRVAPPCTSLATERETPDSPGLGGATAHLHVQTHRPRAHESIQPADPQAKNKGHTCLNRQADKSDF